MKTTTTRSLAEECYRIAKGFQPNAMLDHTDEESILQIENRIAYAPTQSLVVELYPIAAHIEENYVFADSGGQGRLNKLGCAAYLKEALGVRPAVTALASPLSNRDLDRAAEIKFEMPYPQAVALIERSIARETERADREAGFAARFAQLLEQARDESGLKLGLSELIQYRASRCEELLQ